MGYVHPESFRRDTDRFGWRNSLEYRTQQVSRGNWVVERWGGPELLWQYVGTASSYDGARTMAGQDRLDRAAERMRT